MSFDRLVEAHHKLTYSNSVAMVAQQMRNPLRAAVTTKPCTGEAHAASDLLGTGEYVIGEDRTRRNTENPLQRSRRWLVRPQEIKSGQYIDEEDKFDMAMDPTSDLLRAHTVMVERGVADTILGIRPSGGTFEVTESGVLGRAVSGKRKETTSDLPAAQYEPAASTGLTQAKLRAVKKKLRKAEFGMETDDPFYAAITPEQEDDLLAIVVATGASLNAFSIEQLRSGKPTSLMGFEWIMTNRLPVDSSGNRLIPVWAKSNIVLGVWKDVYGKMWNDGSAEEAPVIKVGARVDCVRVQDEGVRVIRCVES